jgi:hypothetical protein
MAQMWPPPKPKLAQDEFDEAVKTNMEDFDMNVRRAVAICMLMHGLPLPPSAINTD